jgi:hypothetical protein
MLAAICMAAGLVVAVLVGYYWGKLWSWIKSVARKLPKIVIEFCIFCKSVVLRLSNLLLAGAIGLAWVFYNQFTGQPLPMNVFWSLVAVMFVCACFGAWREKFLVEESYNVRRPIYEYVKGWVQPTIHIDKNPRPTAVGDASLQLRNMGTVTAYSTKVIIYYCWFDNPSQITRIERDAPLAKSPVHNNIVVHFSVQRPATNYAQVPPDSPPWNFGFADEVAVWFQTESAAGAPDGPIFTDEIQRFSFVPYDYLFRAKEWTLQSSEHQKIVEAHFQEFRRKEQESRSTQLLPTDDKERPQQSTV